MSYDFSTAEPNTFEVIPDNTQVPIILKFVHGEQPDDLHPTKDGDGRMVKLEAIVTGGQYAKRKIFLQYMLTTKRTGAEGEGHRKAINISSSTLRAMVEAARGFSPTDESAQAIEARKLKNISDLDGMEFSVIVGIDKAQPGTTFSDRNSIKRVVPVGKAGEKFDAGKEAASMRSAAPTPAGGARKGW